MDNNDDASNDTNTTTTNNNNNNNNPEPELEEEEDEECRQQTSAEDEAQFRKHMHSLAFEQAHSTKSAVMTPAKFKAIVQFLKNPDWEGTGRGGGRGGGGSGGGGESTSLSSSSSAKPLLPLLDGHTRSWVRLRGFCLGSCPQKGLQDVLMVPAKERGQASSKLLRVLPYDSLFDVVREVHQGQFEHGGYKRVLTYLQERYYGVTRGYVQEFCSMCPVCRPHKRRPVGVADVPLEVFNQILQQSAQYQQNLQNTHKKAGRKGQQQQQDQHQHPLQDGNPAPNVVVADDDGDGDDDDDDDDGDDVSDSEDRALPGGSSSSVSVRAHDNPGSSSVSVRAHDNPGSSSVSVSRSTIRVRSKVAGRACDGSGGKKSARQLKAVCVEDPGEKNSEEEFESSPVNHTEDTESSGAHRERVLHSGTRPTVKGDDDFIVTVNKGFESDEEEKPSKDDNDDDDGGDTSAVSTSMKMSLDDNMTTITIQRTLSGKRLVRLGKRKHVPEASAATISPGQSRSNTDRDQSHKTSFTVSQHAPESSYFPVHPDSIKREKMDEDFADSQTVGGEGCSNLDSERNEDYVVVSKGRHQYLVPNNSVMGAENPQRHSPDETAGDQGLSKNEIDFVIKCEPPDEAEFPEETEGFPERAVASYGSRDAVSPTSRGPPTTHARASSGGCYEHHPLPPPAKKIKEEETWRVGGDPSSSSSSPPPPHPPPNSTTPQFFHRLHVDVIDMTRCPHDDFRFICHVTDHVSKLHVLFPLRQASMGEIAAGLDSHVLAYYGMPRFLHSSRGHRFVEELIEALWKIVDGGVVCVNGECEGSGEEEEGRRGGGLPNVVEELIAMLRVERCSNPSSSSSSGSPDLQQVVPWVSWLPRIVRSLNRDWFAALRRANPVAGTCRGPFL